MSGFLERLLRPASLRGVGFYLDGTDAEPGRRIAVHEFPGRDDPWHEDLGRGPETLRIDGLLIGDDVTRQARRLREAAIAPGPARLVHPWLGTIEVTILSLRLSAAVNERRVIRFSATCQRTGAAPAPVIGIPLIDRVLRAVDDVTDAVLAEVQAVQAALAAGEAAAGTLLGIVRGVESTIRTALTGVGLSTLIGGSLGAALGGLGAATESDAAGPAKGAGLALDALSGVSAAALAGTAAPAPAFAALLGIAERPGVMVPANDGTAGGADAVTSADALSLALRLGAAAEAAAAAEAVDFALRDDALAARDRLAEALAAAADEAGARGWDAAWRQALTLRAASVAALTARAAPLPRLRRLTLAAPMPASLVAFRLDGDALDTVFTRGAQIVGRNAVANPLLVPAGREIEAVL
jgi:prophage DNA circulation protein